MPFLIAAAALLALILLLFVACFLFGGRFFKRDKKEVISTLLADYADRINAGESFLLSCPYETVEMKSFDGVTLRGRYVRAEDPRRVIVCAHGFQSRATRDFGMAAAFYLSKGCNLLLPDHRACGKSDGKYITFGVKESRDIADWAAYISEREPDLPLYLDGISLGSATVLMASGLPLPKSAVGIISDCGFTSPWDICCHVAKRNFRLPKFPFMYITDLYCRLFAGFSLKNDGKVADALKKNKLPIIFVHGGKDDFVPTQMSRDNYAAAVCEKEIYIVDEAGHGLSYAVDKALCEEKLSSFFERHDGSFQC